MTELASTSNLWMTSPALIAIGVVAALAILFWDWRLSLPGLAIIQFGVGQILVYRYGVPGQWPAIYFWVIVAAGLILALSPLQMGIHEPIDRSGNPFFRGLLLVLLAIVVFSIPLELPIPLLDRETLQLFLWLMACSLLVLALTDEAVHTGIGALLWLVPIQSVLAILLPLPALIALLGSVDLLIALACGYLALAENEAFADQRRPLTDITFPRRSPRSAANLGFDALRDWITRRLALIGSILKRVTQ